MLLNFVFFFFTFPQSFHRYQHTMCNGAKRREEKKALRFSRAHELIGVREWCSEMNVSLIEHESLVHYGGTSMRLSKSAHHLEILISRRILSVQWTIGQTTIYCKFTLPSCVETITLSTIISSNFNVARPTQLKLLLSCWNRSSVFKWLNCTMKSLLFHCCWPLRLKIGYDIWTLFEVFINLTLLFISATLNRNKTTTATTTRWQVMAREKRERKKGWEHKERTWVHSFQQRHHNLACCSTRFAHW